MPNLTMYGWAESTAAMRGILGRGLSRGTGRRRRKARKAKASASAPRKRRRKAARGKAHLVKGSAAAKRHMAKLRKMAKRKRG